MKTKDLTITALFIALVYVFTWLIKIQLPFSNQGGLIHLGNVPFFIACIIFGKKIGIISGTVGMTLFDLTSGWVAWAPITFFTNIAIGLAVSKIAYNKDKTSTYLLAILIAAILKVLGYYIGEAILINSLIVPLKSIPGNIIQILLSAIILLIIIKPLRKAFELI
ncbi:MAG: ECF transporter S component [Peptoniphilaceae bacterium]